MTVERIRIPIKDLKLNRDSFTPEHLFKIYNGFDEHFRVVEFRDWENTSDYQMNSTFIFVERNTENYWGCNVFKFGIHEEAELSFETPVKVVKKETITHVWEPE